MNKHKDVGYRLSKLTRRSSRYELQQPEKL